jgi:hypothetical protein
MKRTALFSLLALALAGASVPASAQTGGLYDLAPGSLVTLLMKLYRPVTVDLRDVSLGQAAQVLSQAAHVPISVDPRLLATHVSLSATGAPFAVALEQLARQSNLLIAPVTETDYWTEQVANSLHLAPSPPPPASAATPNAPWSNEWGLNPVSGAFTGASSGTQNSTPGGGNGVRL